MANQQHIEINGKRYDARTGRILAGDTPVAKPVINTDIKPARRMSDVSRPVVSKQVHASAQRSNTLMRHAVKKPSAARPLKAKSGASLVDIAPQVAIKRVNTIYNNADPARNARALKTKRSELVSKFSGHNGQIGAHALPTRVETLPVALAPAGVAPSHHNTHPATSSIIEKGLKNAQSHKQVYHSSHTKTRKRGRMASLAASGLAMLLLGAFITYQNVPNITMRYAATRAGMTASTPDYRPAGFSLNSKVKYTPGQITMSFNSNTDDREFTITQRESSWNSETLRSNYVVATNSAVQTYEDNGRTIYLYGDSNATWVNGGVWYDIKGDSQLNSDQLIRIATSL